MTTVTIGRHSDCGIVLSHPSISRHHAELVIGVRDEYKLVDMNSKYGTYIRHKGSGAWERISAAKLDPSDHVRFGRYDLDARDMLARLPGLLSRKPVVSRDVGSAPVERNPETGEIINRRTQ